jgi:hypothetical protein
MKALLFLYRWIGVGTAGVLLFCLLLRCADAESPAFPP